MEFFVLRNKAMVDDLCGQLKQRRLPFKVAVQDIYPTRTLDSNDYLWGIVYTPIADKTGSSADEVHEAYKKKFNFKHDLIYDPKTKKMIWATKAHSTTRMDMVEIWEYIMKVRADAELEYGIIIQMPNETFINELNFEFEDTHQTKRL